MWDLAVREADYTTADSLVRRLSHLPFSLRAFDAFARGDSAARVRILDEAKRSDRPQGALFAAQFVALHLEDFTTAEQFARFALAPRHKPGSRSSGHLLLAMLELARGRWTAGAAEFASAERLGASDSAREGRALAATLPFLAVPRRQLEAIRADVVRWAPGTVAPEVNPDLATTLRPHLRLYLLGLLSSRLGANADALRYATELERMDVPPDAGAAIRSWAQTLRADVAGRQGRSAEALTALESVRGEIPLELITRHLYSEEHARYLRAEVLYRLGRHDEARRWFETSFQGTPNELVYLAPAHLRLGEIYERTGERAKAAAHYGRFIHLWNNCDPELRPMVEEAKARLATLVSEPARR